jgi:hypothetical protein
MKLRWCADHPYMARALNDAGTRTVPQRLYAMDKTVTQSQAREPGEHTIPLRPSGSGEGSRSALEHLLQQERKRTAQLPREAAGDPAAPPSAP